MHGTRDTPTSGSVIIYADETYKPVLDAEKEVFESLYRLARVEIRYCTEIEALSSLFDDSTNLVFVSRPLNDSEIEYFNAKKYFPKSIIIGKDALALIINKSNRDSLLTLQQFTRILVGDITGWDQINSTSSHGPIKVVFDNPKSGTVRFIIDSITKTKLFPDHIAAVNSNEKVIEYVTDNPSAIGIIGVSWISDRDDTTALSFLDKIRVMQLTRDSIAEPEYCYEPFQAYIATGQYPLSRPIFAINTEPYTGLASGFLAFVASERGQRIILKSGVLPATQPYRFVKVKDDF